jgi:hypothetical protein
MRVELLQEVTLSRSCREDSGQCGKPENLLPHKSSPSLNAMAGLRPTARLGGATQNSLPEN